MSKYACTPDSTKMLGNPGMNATPKDPQCVCLDCERPEFCDPENKCRCVEGRVGARCESIGVPSKFTSMGAYGNRGSYEPSNSELEKGSCIPIHTTCTTNKYSWWPKCMKSGPTYDLVSYTIPEGVEARSYKGEVCGNGFSDFLPTESSMPVSSHKAMIGTMGPMLAMTMPTILEARNVAGTHDLARHKVGSMRFTLKDGYAIENDARTK